MDAGGGVRRLRPVAPGVLVATSRRDRTSSTVLLGPGRTALLVDPAWTPDELDGLAADLDVLRLAVVGVVSTHSHFDHLLWHPRFGSAPRWASARTASAPRGAMLEELGTGYPPSAFLTAPPVRALRGPVPWPGTAVHPVVTDAHAPGHTSLWIPRGRVLLAGDLLSDVEVPLLSEEDPTGAAYRAGLDALEPYAARAAPRSWSPATGTPDATPWPGCSATAAGSTPSTRASLPPTTRGPPPTRTARRGARRSPRSGNTAETPGEEHPARRAAPEGDVTGDRNDRAGRRAGR